MRLETRPERGIHLDLLFVVDGQRIALEFKYLKRRFYGLKGGEHFDLPNQAARDISRYDLVKDITRLERFVAGGIADVGWAVAVTSDGGCWRPGIKAQPVDALFPVHERRVLEGEL